MSDLPRAQHGMRQSRDNYHARLHSGSPWSIWPLLGSMRTAEKVLKVHAQPLTLSACTTTILLLDACCNRQMQYSPRGLKKFMQDTRQKTGAAGANAYSGISRNGYPAFSTAGRRPPTDCSPEHHRAFRSSTSGMYP